jgi:plastocyanin
VRKFLALAALLAAVFAVSSIAMASTTKTTTLKDDFFTKSKLTISKGVTVKWTWSTKDKHTVNELSGKWGSKGPAKKGSFKHKFAKKGKFTVYCLVHPVEMRQTIVVK